jgi:hypothetical protein
MIEIDAAGHGGSVLKLLSGRAPYIGARAARGTQPVALFEASQAQVQCPKSFFPVPKAVSKAVSAPVPAPARPSR